jgi:hypothetical protein
MATVIDSLVVTLGLDPSQFTKGQREALDSFRKTQEEAVKGGKAVEDQSKKSMEALGDIKTQALELFAVFAGGKGAVEFFGQIVKGDAAVGRLARSTNLSAEAINKWQGAARVYGGTAEGMAQSFTTISDAVAGFKVGSVSPLIADFRALGSAGGHVIDINKGVDQTLLDMADNFKAIHDRDPAQAGFMGRKMGIDPGLLDLLMKGSAEVQRMLDKVNALGPATKASTDAAGELEKRWNSMGVKAEAVGRKFLSGDGSGGSVAGFITELSDVLNMTPQQAWDYLNKTDRRGLQGGGSAGSGQSSGGAGGSRGDRNNNPGNMKDGAFARSHGATGNDGGFAVFPDWATGSAAQQALVRGSSYQGLTLDQFAQKYAEGSSAWRNTVGGALGIGGSDIVNNQDPRLIDAIRRAEGTGHGAASTGISAWAGIGGGRGGGSTITNSVVINGPINVVTKATDAAGIAQDIGSALKRQSYAAQANDGQN